jgi:hypothetical protein
MHTYITNGTIYTIGFLMVQSTNGVQRFIPLFDVGSRTDCAIAVNALNGGNADALRSLNILKEYTEGISPQADEK